jgi:hypothetical protein
VRTSAGDRCGPVGRIETRWAMLDAAEHEIAHSIEADSVQLQRVFEGGGDFCQREGLQQAQDLDLLAGGLLAQACLQQAPIDEALRQLPARQGRGLD